MRATRRPSGWGLTPARMSRRAQWIQPFLIILFVFLLIIALVLLTFQKDQLQVTRPQLDKDLIDQRASTTLIALLRTTTAQQGSIADLAIMDARGAYDDRLKAAIISALPQDQAYQLSIAYPDGTMINASTVQLSDYSYASGSTASGYIGVGTATLPGKGGNINVLLLIGDEHFFSLPGTRRTAPQFQVMRR